MSDEIRIGDVGIAGRVWCAPMAGVSDWPFRRACARLGAPYVAAEMVAGVRFAEGRPDMVRRWSGEDIRPKIVQIAARDEEWFARGAEMAEAEGADIIDLNFGCPAREVAGKMSGAALMRDLDKAACFIRAAVGATSRPVTIKMRLGWDDDEITAPSLAKLAQECGVRAVSVHGRTRNQFYRGKADWRAVSAVRAATTLPLIVNGDIGDDSSARAALEQSGADAVMIGRALKGQPWLPSAIDCALRTHKAMVVPDLSSRLEIVLAHFADNVRFYGTRHGVTIFRKHLSWYIEAADGLGDLAMRRKAKTALCRMEEAQAVEQGLIALWRRAESPEYV